MGNSGNKSLKALDMAIEQENEGIKFYMEAAGKSKHNLGKSMFQSFVEDEKEHLKRLKMLRKTESLELKSKGHDVGSPGAKERLLSVFHQMKDELETIIRPETDDLEGIKIAMDIEKTGHKLYQKGYEDATDPREKELFKFLAKEEIIHYEILKNTYKYLDNLDKYHAKEEDRGYDLWVRMINEA